MRRIHDAAPASQMTRRLLLPGLPGLRKHNAPKNLARAASRETCPTRPCSVLVAIFIGLQKIALRGSFGSASA